MLRSRDTGWTRSKQDQRRRGTNCGLLVHVLPGPNKGFLCKPRRRLSLRLKRGHQGCLIYESQTSWAIDGQKLCQFENVSPNEILTIILDLEIW